MATEKAFPSDEADKYVLRFPDGMRDALKAAAAAAGRSMNAEIVARLQDSFSPQSGAASAERLLALQSLVELQSGVLNTFAGLLQAVGDRPGDELAREGVETIKALADRLAARLDEAGLRPATVAVTKRDGRTMPMVIDRTEAQPRPGLAPDHTHMLDVHGLTPQPLAHQLVDVPPTLPKRRMRLGGHKK